MDARLWYGSEKQWTCRLPAERIRLWHGGAAMQADAAEAIRQALAVPEDLPPLRQCVTDSDAITIALDPATPSAVEILREVVRELHSAGVPPENITIIEPAVMRVGAHRAKEQAAAIPELARLNWFVHDPTDESRRAYLASSAAGERLYLAREITDADFVILVGTIGYDPILGMRGTGSVLYPGLTSADALARAHGQGHRELGPDAERPLRQLVDEVTWLLGMQFCVQVIPSVAGGIGHVLAGQPESVFRTGRQVWEQQWRVQLPERAEFVVVAVDGDDDRQTWDDLGAALDTARNLVQRRGKIAVLSQLSEPPGQGVELITSFESPRDALRPIRRESPPDLMCSTQIAGAADWADVYLLSRLDRSLVEDLFMIPLDSLEELDRLVDREADCIIVGGGQHTYGEITSPATSPPTER